MGSMGGAHQRSVDGGRRLFLGPRRVGRCEGLLHGTHGGESCAEATPPFRTLFSGIESTSIIIIIIKINNNKTSILTKKPISTYLSLYKTYSQTRSQINKMVKLHFQMIYVLNEQASHVCTFQN